jgi:uncharacterized membrane protein YebE (DUF533 family)
MFFTVLHPDELNEDQKNWLAIAICGAIIADGNIAPEEVLYLEQALSFLSSKTKIDALIQAVKSGKLPNLDDFKGGTRLQESQIFLELVQVLASDNSLSTREMDYLFTIGHKLGFTKDFVRVVLRWGSEGIVWRRKMHHLVTAGSELERIS